jgi:hypothetical protein
VLEVACIGVPDDKSGEAVKVFVVKDDSLTEKDIIHHCRENLTGYKVPKLVEFRSELPKTNVGKILRRPARPGSRQTSLTHHKQARMRAFLMLAVACRRLQAQYAIKRQCTVRTPIHLYREYQPC